MNGKCIFCLWALMGLTVLLNAQENINIQDLVESMSDRLPAHTDLSQLVDQLDFFQKHPIDLNHTDQEELNQLCFMNVIQIQNLLQYKKEYGEIYDLAELQAIDGFEPSLITCLKPFVCLSPSVNQAKINLKNLIGKGQQYWMSRLGSNLECKNKKYAGDSFKMLSRYHYQFENRIQWHLTIEKDAGETWFSRKNNLGFDFISGNIALQNKGFFQNTILGDYHLQFGQGLVLWSGFGLGLGPEIGTIAKKEIGLKAYTSATEFKFFRGLASTFAYKNIKFTPFISIQNLDAALTQKEDAILIKSISFTGLHRSPTELLQRKSVSVWDAGIVGQFQFKNAQLGAIAHYLKFQYPLVQKPALYQKFQSQNQTQLNYSLFYQYSFRNCYFFGETALHHQKYWATINGLLIGMTKNVSLGILYRNYAKEFHTMHSQAIGQNTRNENEKGFYMGFELRFLKGFKMSAYADYFKFSWLKYQVDAPSNGHLFFIQSMYQWNKTNQILLRYRNRRRPINSTEEVYFNYVGQQNQENLRIQTDLKWHASLSMQTRLELTKMVSAGQVQKGGLAYFELNWVAPNNKYRIGSRLTYFQTDGFDSRIYAFEDHVLYASRLNSFQGKGMSAYLNTSYRINKKWDVWLRYASTKVKQLAWNKDIVAQFRYQF